jgi:hypothetical protein
LDAEKESFLKHRIIAMINTSYKQQAQVGGRLKLISI